jgi:hypothetical protein
MPASRGDPLRDPRSIEAMSDAAFAAIAASRLLPGLLLTSP